MNNIEFVRYYKGKNKNDIWDIIYKSGRVKTIINDHLPRTAETFCILAKNVINQVDKMHGQETIYTND